MDSTLTPRMLFEWCRIPYEELPGHPRARVPFRLCADSERMGRLMARELVDEIALTNAEGRPLRAIIPCGPSCWYPSSSTASCSWLLWSISIKSPRTVEN